MATTATVRIPCPYCGRELNLRFTVETAATPDADHNINVHLHADAAQLRDHAAQYHS